ncbi:MAG: hypothetical protein JWL62_161, partial [Hyphomicrobiales bacterium]|nr:hypothetical protein [Hyphomicrobiales bacterium]
DDGDEGELGRVILGPVPTNVAQAVHGWLRGLPLLPVALKLHKSCR